MSENILLNERLRALKYASYCIVCVFQMIYMEIAVFAFCVYLQNVI